MMFRLRWRITAGTWNLSWPIGPQTLRPPVELAQQADELMQWALQTVRCSRARTRDDLEQVAAALGYHGPAPLVHTWRVDG